MTTVLFFAQAREAAGTRRTELTGDTVAQVLAAADATFGAEFAKISAACTIVVDDEIVPRSEHADHPAGSELAILPPVSGGAGHDADPGPIRIAVLTISDRASSGEYQDLTGPAVEAVLTEHLSAEFVARSLVADEHDLIAAALVDWCDNGEVDLVVTNGGTGLAPRDVTPEATRSVLDVEAPGIGELMRAAGLAHTPFAALSRQVAGRRGRTIIVNLPGSVKGATENLEAVVTVLGHACATAKSGVL